MLGTCGVRCSASYMASSKGIFKDTINTGWRVKTLSERQIHDPYQGTSCSPMEEYAFGISTMKKIPPERICVGIPGISLTGRSNILKRLNLISDPRSEQDPAPDQASRCYRKRSHHGCRSCLSSHQASFKVDPDVICKSKIEMIEFKINREFLTGGFKHKWPPAAK